MGPVRFGIVGCGQAAYFHIPAAKSNPKKNVEFVAAYDVNERALKRLSKMHKLTPYSELDQFLASDIDAVLLAVPHYLHAQLTKKVADAGKHVLCEKPMATTLEECDSMIAEAKKAGVKLMIAENHRFLPAHTAIKEAVEKGLIGDVFLGRAYEGAYVPKEQFLDPDSWHFTYDRAGGGVVADQGPHKFATLNWILGDVDSAQCWLGKAMNSPPSKGEDCAIVLLRYVNGAMVTVDVSSVTVHPLTNRLELHGTKGTIVEDHSWEQPVRIFSSHESAQVKGEFYSPHVEHATYPEYYILSARIEDSYFAECVQKDTEPEFTPVQAREAVAVTLLAYLSAKNHRRTERRELDAVAKSKGTKSILDGLNDVMLKNYGAMHWS